MEEKIRLRDNFADIDVANVAAIQYELVDGLPDFSTYSIDSEQTIVLRNVKTKEL